MLLDAEGYHGSALVQVIDRGDVLRQQELARTQKPIPLLPLVTQRERP